MDVFISAVWFLSVFSLSAFLCSHILILLTLSSMNFLYFFQFNAKLSMVSGSWPACLSSVIQYPIVVCLAFLCWSEISGAGQPNTNCLVNLLLSILSMCPILIKCRFSIFSSILSMVNCFLTPNIFILFSCISLIGGLVLLAHIYRYNLSISLCNLFISDLYHGRTAASNSAVDSTHVCATIACWRFVSLVFFSLFLR